MRHSGLMVQTDANSDNFDVHHIIGTPGVGMTYEFKEGLGSPSDETASLLSMDFVAWMPRSRVRDVKGLAEQVQIIVSREWNCQNWVREALRHLVVAGLITAQQRDAVVTKQLRAINAPYMSNTPNSAVLEG
jgi:hypothetical protein